VHKSGKPGQPRSFAAAGLVGSFTDGVQSCDPLERQKSRTAREVASLATQDNRFSCLAGTVIGLYDNVRLGTIDGKSIKCSPQRTGIAPRPHHCQLFGQGSGGFHVDHIPFARVNHLAAGPLWLDQTTIAEDGSAGPSSSPPNRVLFWRYRSTVVESRTGAKVRIGKALRELPTIRIAGMNCATDEINVVQERNVGTYQALRWNRFHCEIDLRSHKLAISMDGRPYARASQWSRTLHSAKSPHEFDFTFFGLSGNWFK